MQPRLCAGLRTGPGGGLRPCLYVKGVQKFLITVIGQPLEEQQQVHQSLAECQEQWPQDARDVPSTAYFAAGSTRFAAQ